MLATEMLIIKTHPGQSKLYDYFQIISGWRYPDIVISNPVNCPRCDDISKKVVGE